MEKMKHFIYLFIFIVLRKVEITDVTDAVLYNIISIYEVVAWKPRIQGDAFASPLIPFMFGDLESLIVLLKHLLSFDFCGNVECG